MQDVAAVPENKVGNCGVQSFAIWALNQQNGRVSHKRSPTFSDATVPATRSTIRAVIHEQKGRRCLSRGPNSLRERSFPAQVESRSRKSPPKQWHITAQGH